MKNDAELGWIEWLKGLAAIAASFLAFLLVFALPILLTIKIVVLLWSILF